MMITSPRTTTKSPMKPPMAPPHKTSTSVVAPPKSNTTTTTTSRRTRQPLSRPFSGKDVGTDALSPSETNKKTRMVANMKTKARGLSPQRLSRRTNHGDTTAERSCPQDTPPPVCKQETRGAVVADEGSVTSTTTDQSSLSSRRQQLVAKARQRSKRRTVSQDRTRGGESPTSLSVDRSTSLDTDSGYHDLEIEVEHHHQPQPQRVIAAMAYRSERFWNAVRGESPSSSSNNNNNNDSYHLEPQGSPDSMSSSLNSGDFPEFEQQQETSSTVFRPRPTTSDSSCAPQNQRRNGEEAVSSSSDDDGEKVHTSLSSEIPITQAVLDELAADDVLSIEFERILNEESSQNEPTNEVIVLDSWSLENDDEDSTRSEGFNLPITDAAMNEIASEDIFSPEIDELPETEKALEALERFEWNEELLLSSSSSSPEHSPRHAQRQDKPVKKRAELFSLLDDQERAHYRNTAANETINCPTPVERLRRRNEASVFLLPKPSTEFRDPNYVSSPYESHGSASGSSTSVLDVNMMQRLKSASIARPLHDPVQINGKTLVPPIMEELEWDSDRQEHELLYMRQQVRMLLMEKDSLCKRLYLVQKAFDQRSTPFRDLFDERRKLRSENARLMAEQHHVDGMIAALQTQTISAVQAAVTKAKEASQHNENLHNRLQEAHEENANLKKIIADLTGAAAQANRY